MKMKTKIKTKMKNKMKTKTKMKMKMNFRFCFHFLFLFLESTLPRGAIDSQLSFTWPKSAIAISFANFPSSLAVL